MVHASIKANISLVQNSGQRNYICTVLHVLYAHKWLITLFCPQAICWKTFHRLSNLTSLNLKDYRILNYPPLLFKDIFSFSNLSKLWRWGVCITFDNLHSGLQREKCEHDSWCKHAIFSIYYASCMIFVKHKPSTGSTQQEVTLRYNLFTFTHTHTEIHACEWSFMFWNLQRRGNLETTASVNMLYNNRLSSHSDVYYFDFISNNVPFFYIFFLVFCGSVT